MPANHLIAFASFPQHLDFAGLLLQEYYEGGKVMYFPTDQRNPWALSSAAKIYSLGVLLFQQATLQIWY